MEDVKEQTVQDHMTEELLVEDHQGNELVEVMSFFKDNGVPLTNHQAKAIFILQEHGIDDLANYIVNVRRKMTPVKRIYELINKLTLADRIKGNAKLSKILGQQVQVPQDPTTNRRVENM
jgi:vancomycin permeability regulator SanA